MLKRYKKFKVACIQMNSQDNFESNIRFIEKKINISIKKKVKLIVLPENCFFMAKNNNYLLKFNYSESKNPGILKIQELAKKFKIWIIIGSVSVREKKNFFNRSLLIDPNGKIKLRYNKIHLFSAKLPNGDFYNERKYFNQGNKISLLNTSLGKIGLTICYDLRFSYLYRKLAIKGAEIITIPSAFTNFTGKLHWHSLLKSRAIETGCYILAPAQQGIHPDGRKTFGHTIIVDPWGKIINESKNKENIIISEININKVYSARNAIQSLKLNVKI